MRFNDLFEAVGAEPEDFISYKNPTSEQMNKVAGSSGKIRFSAFRNKIIIVFPYDMDHKDFLRSIGKSLDLENSIHGIAQKTGMSWLVSKILNAKQVTAKEFKIFDWSWIDKYVDIKPWFKHFTGEKQKENKKLKEMEPRIITKSSKNAGGYYDSKNKVSGIKQTLKDFLEKRRESFGPEVDKHEKN